MPDPRDPIAIASAYLGVPRLTEGIWPSLPKDRVFDPGAPVDHVRRALAMELLVAGRPRYVLYTIDMGPALRSLKAECLVLDPDQPIATDQVTLLANFGRNECHLDLTEIRYRVEQHGAELLQECEAALRELLALARHDQDRFVTTLHEPLSSSRSTLSVYTVSGGKYGGKRSH